MASLVCYQPALPPRAQLDSYARPYEPTYYEAPLAPRIVPSSRELHEVWEGNLDEEFNALLAAVSRAGSPDAIVALDMEFPGFVCEDPRYSSHEAHHEALRRNIDQLWPIQLGVAVLGSNGQHRGVWTFNLHFDANVDAHTKESLTFLKAAGIDFPRHQAEGINALALGRRLANSSLVGAHGQAPCWLTFSGAYDWGYLLKLVTQGRALPGLSSTFDKVISVYCPNRRDLRDLLPNGSLEALGRKHGVKRWGSAHTAGSDALLTLDLFMLLGGPKMEAHATSQWTEMGWHNEEGWYGSCADQWHPGNLDGMQVAGSWGESTWEQNHASDSWFSPIDASSKSLEWYQPSWFQPWVAAL